MLRGCSKLPFATCSLNSGGPASRNMSCGDNCLSQSNSALGRQFTSAPESINASMVMCEKSIGANSIFRFLFNASVLNNGIHCSCVCGSMCVGMLLRKTVMSSWGVSSVVRHVVVGWGVGCLSVARPVSPNTPGRRLGCMSFLVSHL